MRTGTADVGLPSAGHDRLAGLYVIRQGAQAHSEGELEAGQKLSLNARHDTPIKGQLRGWVEERLVDR